MTPIESAARADQQGIWPWSNRIMETLPTSLESIQQPPSIRNMDLPRSAWSHIQAGLKWLESKRTQQLASRRLRLAETISLGEKRSVSIVQVDGSHYLIGCSAGSVQLLAVLDKQDAVTTRLSDEARAS